MNHKSTYIVISESSLIHEILSESFEGINSHFNIFKSPTIYSDLILSCNTDLNLNNKYLLESIGAITEDEISDLYGIDKKPSVQFEDYIINRDGFKYRWKSPFVRDIGKI
jgi:hypothetical protein